MIGRELLGEADALLQRLGAAVLVFDQKGRVLIDGQDISQVPQFTDRTDC